MLIIVEKQKRIHRTIADDFGKTHLVHGAPRTTLEVGQNVPQIVASMDSIKGVSNEVEEQHQDDWMSEVFHL